MCDVIKWTVYAKEVIYIKKERSFLGLFILGIGAYFLLKHWHILIHQRWIEWPSLLMIIGIFLFIYAWTSGELDLLFPTFLLIGIGAQFYFSGHFSSWPKPATFYPFLIGIGFLIRYYKVKKSGLFLGLILLLIGILPLLKLNIEPKLHHYLGTLGSYWPVLLIVIGLILFIKKK